MAWLCTPSSGHPSIAGRGFHLTPLGDSMRHNGNPKCPCRPVNLTGFEDGRAMWMHFAADGRAYDGPGPWAGLLSERLAVSA